MKIILILAIMAAALAFSACGDGTTDKPTTPAGALTGFATIGQDNNLPLIDESCWDWYPEGDGVFWAISGPTGGAALSFPFKKVVSGKAEIEELGQIKSGDVVFVRGRDGAFYPIFKIVEINPTKGGVRVAPTGNNTGKCNMPGSPTKTTIA